MVSIEEEYLREALGGDVTPPSDLYDHAKRYESWGLTPFPLKPRSKEPLVRWKEFDDTEWFRGKSLDDCNIAIRCTDGVFAIDVDGSPSSLV